MSKLYRRFIQLDNQHAIVESLEPGGESLSEVIKIEDKKTFLLITYTVWFKQEPRQMNIVYGKTAGIRGYRWLRTA